MSDIKIINYEKLKNLSNRNYGFIVIDDLSSEIAKDIKSIKNFFIKTGAVSDTFKFNEMYIYQYDNKKSLVIGLKDDEGLGTNFFNAQLTLLLNGIKIYWLSDFLFDLENEKNINNDIKI